MAFLQWCLFLVVAFLSSLSFVPYANGLKLVTSDAKLPAGTCGYGLPISAVYDGIDSVYVFCIDAIARYSLSTEILLLLYDSRPPVEQETVILRSAADLGGRPSFYRIGWLERESETDANNTIVWRGEFVGEDFEELTWAQVTGIGGMEFDFGSAVWDGDRDEEDGNIYLLGYSRQQGSYRIFKLSLTDGLTFAGNLPAPRNAVAVVWVPAPDSASAYVIGGHFGDDAYSNEIHKYDPATEDVSLHASLPVPVARPGAVWTGKEVLLVCGGHVTGQPEYNFMRFNPNTDGGEGGVLVEAVDGFDFYCAWPGAVYIESTNRVYVFGGLFETDEQPISYIDLDEEDGTSTSTEPVTGLGRLKLEFGDAKLPEACNYASAFTVSAVHDGEDTAYIFCSSVVLKYELSTDRIIDQGTTPVLDPDFGTSAWVADERVEGGRLFIFVAIDGFTSGIWEGATEDLSGWNLVGSLPYQWFAGATFWDGAEFIYLIHGAASPTIKRFSVLNYEIVEVLELETRLIYFSTLWAPELRFAFTFGGSSNGSVGEDIWKYVPDQGSFFTVSSLPLPQTVDRPGAVWTGKHAYLTCADYNSLTHEHNFIRFDPVTNEAVTVEVNGWDFYCMSPAAIYSPTRNRVYAFGGTNEDGEQPIMYIDLGAVEDPPTSTSTSTTTEEPMYEHELIITDSVLPDECGSYSFGAALYDESQDDDTVYLICEGIIFTYALSSNMLTELTRSIVEDHASAAVLTNDGRVFMTAWTESGGTGIWESHINNLEQWEPVDAVSNDKEYGAVIYDGLDDIYIIGASKTDPTVRRFSISEGKVTEAGALSEVRYFTSGFWFPEENSAYVFGGMDSEHDYLTDILKYDPSTGAASHVADFPVTVSGSCVLWTGSEALSLGGGLFSYPDNNFMRFDPFSSEVKVERVRGFDWVSRRAGCAYSRKLNRVYMLGGAIGDGEVQRISYIQLEDSPSTATETPSTAEQQTTTDASSTTEQQTTTDSPSTTEQQTTTDSPSTTEQQTTTDSPSTTEQQTTTDAPSTTEEQTTTTTAPTTMPTTTMTSITTTITSTSATTTDATVTTTTSTSTTTAPSTTTATTTTTKRPGSAPGCRALDKYGVRYEALVGAFATNPCPGVSNGTASWFCVANDTFQGDNPDYSNCTTGWIADLKDIIEEAAPINSTQASDVLRDVQRRIEEALDPASSTTYFGHEIETLFEIGEGVLSKVENSTQLADVETLADTAFGIFDQVLTHSDPWEELSQRDKARSGSTFMQASENTALGLGHRFQNQQKRTRADSPSYRKTFDASSEFLSLSGAETVPSSVRITFPTSFNSKSHSYIEIPVNWATHFQHEEYVALSGLRLSHTHASALFIPSNTVSAGVTADQGGSPTGKIINGPLLGFTFAGGRSGPEHGQSGVNFTGTGVRITFEHEVPAWGPERAEVRRRLHAGERPMAVLGSGICVYWDEANLNWSPNGCRLVSSTPERTVCECNHLTAFAVIMDLHDYIGKTLVLEVMTWILLSLSIVCLFVTIAVLLYSRYGRPLLKNHPRNDLTLNLCVALLVANMLILVTMDKHNLHLSEDVCTASAIGLHYALLVAFAWMALEGLLLAKLVFIDIFASGREYAGLERTGALLVPAIIVGATCGVNFGRGDHAYGNDAYCWLHGRYLWSFISVVAAVLVFNVSVLIMSIRKSYLLHENPSRKVARKAKSASFLIRGALSLAAIMGLTWASGFLMLLDNPTVANVAAYIFTASNASQGVFIFYFHIASSKKIRSHFGRSLWFSTKTTEGTGTRASESEPKSATDRKNMQRKGTLGTLAVSNS